MEVSLLWSPDISNELSQNCPKDVAVAFSRAFSSQPHPSKISRKGLREPRRKNAKNGSRRPSGRRSTQAWMFWKCSRCCERAWLGSGQSPAAVRHMWTSNSGKHVQTQFPRVHVWKLRMILSPALLSVTWFHPSSSGEIKPQPLYTTWVEDLSAKETRYFSQESKYT